MSASVHMGSVWTSSTIPFSHRSINAQLPARQTPYFETWKMQDGDAHAGHHLQNERYTPDANKENAIPPTSIQYRTRAALPRSLQPARRQREDLNPLTRSLDARRIQQRESFLRLNRQRRDDAMWNVRGNQIQQQDSINEWREFTASREAEVPVAEDYEHDVPQITHPESLDVPSSLERSPQSVPATRMPPSRDFEMTSSRDDITRASGERDLEAFLHSQEAELDALIALNQPGPDLCSPLPPSRFSQPPWQPASFTSSPFVASFSEASAPPPLPSSPHSKYFSDDDEFEQAMLDAWDDGEQMDTSK